MKDMKAYMKSEKTSAAIKIIIASGINLKDEELKRVRNILTNDTYNTDKSLKLIIEILADTDILHNDESLSDLEGVDILESKQVIHDNLLLICARLKSLIKVSREYHSKAYQMSAEDDEIDKLLAKLERQANDIDKLFFCFDDANNFRITMLPTKRLSEYMVQHKDEATIDDPEIKSDRVVFKILTNGDCLISTHGY